MEGRNTADISVCRQYFRVRVHVYSIARVFPFEYRPFPISTSEVVVVQDVYLVVQSLPFVRSVLYQLVIPNSVNPRPAC